MNIYYGKRPIIENSQKITVSTVVREAVCQIKEKYNATVVFDTEESVNKFIKALSGSAYLRTSTEEKGETKEICTQPIKLTYTQSNLGKGYVFWFMCNYCNCRARHLYIPPHSRKMLCRSCHRLAYSKQNTHRDKEIARLVSNPQLRRQYLASGNINMQMKAIAAQSVWDQAYENATSEVNRYKKYQF